MAKIECAWCGEEIDYYGKMYVDGDEDVCEYCFAEFKRSTENEDRHSCCRACGYFEKTLYYYKDRENGLYCEECFDDEYRLEPAKDIYWLRDYEEMQRDLYLQDMAAERAIDKYLGK